MASDKGRERYPASLDNAGFVQALFDNLIPEQDMAGELSGEQWTALLDAGYPRSEITWRLISTNEYLGYFDSVATTTLAAFYDYCNYLEGDAQVACFNANTSDPDGDGVPNEIEINNGYDPTKPDLIIAKPALTATEPSYGAFALDWNAISSPDENKAIFYRVMQSANGQPQSTLSADYASTHYELFRADGNYDYSVQACIAGKVDTICGQTSDEVGVTVTASVVEPSAQPEAKPTDIAAQQSPSQSDIDASAAFGLTAGEFRGC